MKFLVVFLFAVLAQSIHSADHEDGALVVSEDHPHTVDATVSDESFIDPDSEPFIPTKEWQAVKKGQAIPAGLHVRLNLQTGEREAKLLDEAIDEAPRVQSGGGGSDSPRLEVMKQAIIDAMAELDESQLSDDEKPDPKFQHWKSGDRQGIFNREKDSFTRDELKEALKNFKANQDDVQDPQLLDKMKGKHFKNMDQLKEEFREMKMEMKTENQILGELMARYERESITNNEKVTLLEDLEYYLHQIDNALDFCTMGGLSLLLRDLNSTDASIKSYASLALAAALQSNAKVQTQAIEASVLPLLLRVFSIESSTIVQSRMLHALSALLRHFPYAQSKFIELGGLHAFDAVLRQSADNKLRVKVLTLLHDLVQEKIGVNDSDEQDTKTQQYAKVNFSEYFTRNNWCSVMVDLLSLPDHDSREKVLVCAELFTAECHEQLKSSSHILSSLREEYKVLAKEEEDTDSDSYFTNIYSILRRLTVKNVHDEF